MYIIIMRVYTRPGTDVTIVCNPQPPPCETIDKGVKYCNLKTFWWAYILKRCETKYDIRLYTCTPVIGVTQRFPNREWYAGIQYYIILFLCTS